MDDGSSSDVEDFDDLPPDVEDFDDLPPDDEADSSVASDHSDVDAEDAVEIGGVLEIAADPAVLEAPPAKRPRGRPRKLPVRVDAEPPLEEPLAVVNQIKTADAFLCELAARIPAQESVVAKQTRSALISAPGKPTTLTLAASERAFSAAAPRPIMSAKTEAETMGYASTLQFWGSPEDHHQTGEVKRINSNRTMRHLASRKQFTN